MQQVHSCQARGKIVCGQSGESNERAKIVFYASSLEFQAWPLLRWRHRSGGKRQVSRERMDG